MSFFGQRFGQQFHRGWGGGVGVEDSPYRKFHKGVGILKAPYPPSHVCMEDVKIPSKSKFDNHYR
jgi:hypothetical protein